MQIYHLILTVVGETEQDIVLLFNKLITLTEKILFHFYFKNWHFTACIWNYIYRRIFSLFQVWKTQFKNLCTLVFVENLTLLVFSCLREFSCWGMARNKLLNILRLETFDHQLKIISLLGLKIEARKANHITFILTDYQKNWKPLPFHTNTAPHPTFMRLKLCEACKPSLFCGVIMLGTLGSFYPTNRDSHCISLTLPSS